MDAEPETTAPDAALPIFAPMWSLIWNVTDPIEVAGVTVAVSVTVCAETLRSANLSAATMVVATGAIVTSNVCEVVSAAPPAVASSVSDTVSVAVPRKPLGV